MANALGGAGPERRHEGGGRSNARAPGAIQYPYAERDTHFHFNSYRNLREKVVHVYDDYHTLLDKHRSSTMPASVWNDLVVLKRRFDALLCCPAPECNEFIASTRGEVRVIKCGHVCHKECHAAATHLGMCKTCRHTDD
jgi:hypothetical protein